MRLLMIALILGWGSATVSSAENATPLLRAAQAEFERNEQQQLRWQVSALETRYLISPSGRVERLPSVKVKSMTRTGDRCADAVLEWGEPRTSQLAQADVKRNCQIEEEFRGPFRVPALLRSLNVELITRAPSNITVAILPDKKNLDSSDPEVRCAASIAATIGLEPATLFPYYIDAEVVENGCDQEKPSLLKNHPEIPAGRVLGSFRKGASFRLEYLLLDDKFHDAKNRLWICARQHYSLPFSAKSIAVLYWGRLFRVGTHPAGLKLVEDVQVTAREFGSQSSVFFPARFP